MAIFLLSKCSGGKYHPQERRLSIVEKVVDIAEELTARTDVGQMSQSPSQRLQFFDNSAVVQIIPVVIRVAAKNEVRLFKGLTPQKCSFCCQ